MIRRTWSSLTPSQVQDIKSRPAKHGLIKELSAEFGYSHAYISLIRSGERLNNHTYTNVLTEEELYRSVNRAVKHLATGANSLTEIAAQYNKNLTKDAELVSLLRAQANKTMALVGELLTRMEHPKMEGMVQ